MSTKEITSTISRLIETLGNSGKTAEDVSPYLKELSRKHAAEGEGPQKSPLVANGTHRGWTVVTPG